MRGTVEKVNTRYKIDKLKVLIDGLLTRVYFIGDHIINLEYEIAKAKEKMAKTEKEIKIKMDELQELANIELKEEAETLREAGL